MAPVTPVQPSFPAPGAAFMTTGTTPEVRRQRSGKPSNRHLLLAHLENRMEELASIMEFVDQDPGGPIVRYGPGTAMLERHSELQIRRRKIDVLPELPPKQVIELSVPLLPAQQAAYDRAERDGVIQLKAKGPLLQVRHILELILRLKQLCNFSPAGKSAKIEDMRRRLEVLDEEGHRALLF